MASNVRVKLLIREEENSHCSIYNSESTLPTLKLSGSQRCNLKTKGDHRSQRERERGREA